MEIEQPQRELPKCELPQSPQVFYWCARCNKRARVDYRQITASTFRDENVKLLIEHVRDLPKSSETNYRGCLEHFVTSVMDINTNFGHMYGETVAWHRLEIIY